jgi:hypothetical protein
MSISKIASFQEVIIGAPIRRRLALRQSGPGRNHPPFEAHCNGSYDLVLHSEYIGNVAIIPFSPHMGTVRGIDQLGGDPDATPQTPDTALKNIRNAEFPFKILDLWRSSLVVE